MPDEVHKLTSVGRLPACPYPGVPSEDLSRLSADVSYEDKRTLHSFCVALGIHNRIVQIFYHRVAEDCRDFLKQNPSATLDDREQFLLITVNRRTATQPTSSISNSNESGPAPGKHSETPGSSNVQTNNPQKLGRGSRRKDAQKEVGKQVSGGGLRGESAGNQGQGK